MKRIISIALCLIIGTMGMALYGCGDKYADSPYLGKYVSTTCEYGGYEMPTKDIIGGDFTITFNADGSCEVAVGEDTKSGDWEPTDDGVKLFDSEDEMAFTGDDKALTVEYNGATFNFEKE